MDDKAFNPASARASAGVAAMAICAAMIEHLGLDEDAKRAILEKAMFDLRMGGRYDAATLIETTLLD